MFILDENISMDGTAEFVCECGEITHAKWIEDGDDQFGPIVRAIVVTAGCDCGNWELEVEDRIMDYLMDTTDYDSYDVHCDDLDDPF